MKKFVLLVIIFLLLTGCGKSVVNLEPNYKIEPKELNNCSNNYKSMEYFSDNNQKVYLVCLSDIMLKDGKNSISLKDYLNQNTIDNVITEFTSKLIYDTGLFDGGTLIYKTNDDTKYVDGDLIFIKCNTLEGNKDIYIGSGNMDISGGFEQGLCGHK